MEINNEIKKIKINNFIKNIDDSLDENKKKKNIEFIYNSIGIKNNIKDINELIKLQKSLTNLNFIYYLKMKVEEFKLIDNEEKKIILNKIKNFDNLKKEDLEIFLKMNLSNENSDSNFSNNTYSNLLINFFNSISKDILLIIRNNLKNINKINENSLKKYYQILDQLLLGNEKDIEIKNQIKNLIRLNKINNEIESIRRECKDIFILKKGELEWKKNYKKNKLNILNNALKFLDNFSSELKLLNVENIIKKDNIIIKLNKLRTFLYEYYNIINDPFPALNNSMKTYEEIYIKSHQDSIYIQSVQGIYPAILKEDI